jgi:hypothetical protein
MGNRYNNKTQTLLRPKVCKGPPPPPPPETPVVTTDCCPLGIAQTLTFAIITAQCPALVGLSCLMTNPGPSGGTWSGVLHGPPGTNDIDVRLACTDGAWQLSNNASTSPGTAAWLNDPASTTSDMCSPFVANFSLRMQRGWVPNSCLGSARNFTARISG